MRSPLETADRPGDATTVGEIAIIIAMGRASIHLLGTATDRTPGRPCSGL